MEEKRGETGPSIYDVWISGESIVEPTNFEDLSPNTRSNCGVHRVLNRTAAAPTALHFRVRLDASER